MALSAYGLIFLFICHEKKFVFSIVDILWILLIAYWVTRYDFYLELANWKIIQALQLIFLWFSARALISISNYPNNWVAWIFIVSGCVQAVWGFLQLYGNCSSNHSLFLVSGSFYNPGPFSGYVGMMIPIALHQWLITKGVANYCAFGALVLMLCILPIGMSRSAWLGVFFASVWVVLIQQKLLRYFILFRNKKPFLFICGLIWLVISIFVIIIVLYTFKKDSADGRLFIWRNTLHIIAEKPLTGYGPGTFSLVYGEEQASYFRNENNYTMQEERVAGSPEYAFNEYLQLMVEGGLVLLSLFSLLVGYCLWKGCKNKEYGFCGSLMFLLIFASSSYPLQLPSFLVAGTLLLVICISKDNSFCFRKSKQLSVYSSVLFVIASATLCVYLNLKSSTTSIWQKSRLLKLSGEFEIATTGYKSLYNDLKHHPDFLFEYAQCLSGRKKYLEANVVLRRAALVSCDPMIYNVMGQNYQNMKLYTKAEECFLRSTHLLPGRIYPYYLLAMLYAEPSFYQEEKMRLMVEIVLTKKPKVESKAIEDMRREVKEKLVERKGYDLIK